MFKNSVSTININAPATPVQNAKTITLKERRKRIIQLFRFLIVDILRERLQQRVLGKKWVDKGRSERNRYRARRFRTTALELGGVLIKLGQYLSTRFDLLPEEWLEELAQLQDAVPSVDFEELRPFIEQDFGDKLENLFLEFDTKPLASASLGQVHKARLLDGSEVAVKILRPGITSIIETDLEALNRVIDFLRKRTDMGKMADMKGIAREFEVTLRRELDYMQEGRNAERIKENLKSLRYIYVPKVYWERTSSRVITTEFINGYKILDLAGIDAAGIDRYRIAQILANCYLNQILVDGFFHADPHPGNLFVRVDPAYGVQVAFVDFGMVGEITPDMRRHLRRMVVATMQRDVEGVLNSMRALNFIHKESDVDKVRIAIGYVLDKFLGRSLGDLRKINYGKMFEELSFVIYSQPLYLPSDFSFLTRAVDILANVCSTLSPELNLMMETRPFMRQLIDEEIRGTTPGSLINPELLEQLRVAVWDFLTLPRTLSNTLQQMQNEQLHVQTQTQEVKRTADKIEKIGNRIFSGVVAAGALVSTAVFTNTVMQNWRKPNESKPKNRKRR